MEDKKPDNIGCAKALGYASLALLGLFVITGALQGIGEIFSNIPWPIMVILGIGYLFMWYKIFE